MSNKQLIFTVLISLILNAVMMWYFVKDIPNVSLPEEYRLITHDSTHPDLLIGYYDKNGVLQIGFKH